MEGQGNILKTLFIAAVVYTLALGAPVKRNTSSSIVTEICSTAKHVRMSTMCSSATTTRWSFLDHYEENFTAEILSQELQKQNFTGMVCEAVWKCLNSSDPDPQKCELAAAAIRLQDTIRRFMMKHGEETWVQTMQNSCNDCILPAVEVDIKQILCNATVYILDLLDEIDVMNTKPFYTDCQI